jgi:hypothetical protein
LLNTSHRDTSTPFALNPINPTDSNAIANAFLQYQAEFMTLFAHLSSTFSTSDHSVIHGFLHAQIITNTIQHHIRPIDQSINAVNDKLSQTKVEIQNSISNSHKNKFISHTALNLEPKIPSSPVTFANVVSSLPALTASPVAKTILSQPWAAKLPTTLYLPPKS